MNELQLPPERDLPGAGRMVDDILGDVREIAPSRPTPAPRRRWPLAVAAVAVLAVGAAGVVWVNSMLDRPALPANTPSASASASATPSADPTPTSDETSGPIEHFLRVNEIEWRFVEPTAERSQRYFQVDVDVSATPALNSYTVDLLLLGGDTLSPVTDPGLGAWGKGTPHVGDFSAGTELREVYTFAVPEGSRPLNFRLTRDGTSFSVPLAGQDLERPQQPVIVTAFPGKDPIQTLVFDLTVDDVQALPGGGFSVHVKQCNAGGLPISGGDGAMTVGPQDWGWRPTSAPNEKFQSVIATDFPETSLQSNDCSEGRIAASGQPGEELSLRYAPAGLGDEITWILPSPASDRPSGPVTEAAQLGETVKTQYFDVTVDKSEGNHEATAMAVHVKVCYAVEQPEANADGTTLTSTDPWRFGVYDGETQTVEAVRFLRVSEFPASSEWSPAYETKLLTVGECNEGWIAVADGNPDLARPFVRYQPADFGDEITWQLDFTEQP